jgi:hypothetical protein
MTTQLNNLGIVFPDNTTQTTASVSTVLPTPGAAGQILTSDGTNWTSATPAVPPVATAATNLKNGAVGAVPYQSAADTTAFLSIGTTGQVLSVSAGGLPTWTTAAAPGTPLNSVQYNSASAFAGSANMTFNGTTLTLANDAVVNSVAVGQGLTSSVGSTALGINALKLNTGPSNTALGSNAGAAITTGSDNTLVGTNAGKLITNATFNVYVGAGVGQKATQTRQTGVGAYALQNCTTGDRNVAIGFGALGQVTTTGSNTAIGTSALGVSTGSFNTAVGNSAGISMTSGSNNTLIGGYTGNNAALDIRTLSNYIVLSDGAGNVNLYIDNTRNTVLNGTVTTAGYFVGTLPVSAVVGMRAYVTDANAPTFGDPVVGGGVTTIPVFYNGAAWIVG